MNLEESDKFQQRQQQNEKKKKIVLASIVLCAVLIALLIVLIIYIQYQDSLQLKMYIDGTQVEISSNLYYEQDDITYVNVKTLSSMLGYTYTKGEYKKYNENEDSCYLQNDLEIVAITVGEDSYTKYIQVADGATVLTAEGVYGTAIQVKSENGSSNIFTIDTPMILVDSQIYMPFEYITDMFNCSVNTSEANRIRIYTLPTLFQSAVQTAASLGYSTISGVYENIRAIPYGLIVVGSNNVYGVISSTVGGEILSVKYEDLEFIQNAQEFFMRAEDTVGLIASDGTTIIKPMDYDDMSILDEVEQLYLVEKDGKYGVVNRKGEIVIHVDYDRIGLKNIENFSEAESMRNTYLLHDQCIVAELDGLYGMYSLDGDELLKTVYESIGYTITSTDTSGEESVLLIPASVGIKGIVVQFNGLYGIYDVNVNSVVIPCACTRIYSITKSGETTYYMEFGGNQINLEEYLVAYDLVSETEDDDEEETEETSTNTDENETTTSEENVSEENIEETTESEADVETETEENVESEEEENVEE